MNHAAAVSRTAAQIRRELTELRGEPRERARTISAAYYTSAEFLEVEKEQLFRKDWICIGHEGEIPKPGDYFVTELVGEQLLIVRGEDSRVRIFSNVCRHRGNLLVRSRGNVGRFICGYHAWCYALDGRLIAAPLMGAFAKSGCRLHEFAMTSWKGFIFVNLSCNPAPLAQAVQEIEPYVRNYHPEQRHFLRGFDETWQTNWKCLAENFMEGYHLSPMHAKTLHAITPTRLCEKLPNGAAFTGYRANFDASYPERGPYHEDLTPLERRSDVFYWIYPGFVVGFAPHFTLYMCLRPLTVDSVGIRWGIVGVPEDPDSPVVRAYVQLCKDFCAEDRATLEALQLALGTRHFGGGPLAGNNYEGTIWDMYQFMATRLGDT